MEHIIQFGITVDDEEIKRMISQKASEQVVKEVRKELKIDTYNSSYVTRICNEEITNIMLEHKDEIIERTAQLLVERLYRTKQVKERVAQVLDDVMGGAK